MIKKVLIVGYGVAGKRYFNIVKKNFPNINLKILSFTNYLKNENFLQNFSEIKIFRPDLSIICNPSSIRIKIIKLLTELNSHLLIEKPLTSSYKDAKKIIKLSSKKKIILKVGYNLRFLNSLNMFRKIIFSKLIGKIYSADIIVGHNISDWRKNIDYRNTVSAKKKLGGGVLLELSHEFDYAFWIFGKFTKVFCRNSKISNLKIDVEDNAQIIIFSKKKHTLRINLDFCRSDKIRTCYVTGENGSLFWDCLKNKVKLFNNERKKWIDIKFKKNCIKDTYLLQLRDMIKLCNSRNHGKSNLVGIKSAAKTVKFIDCARYSSKSLKVINFK